MCSGVGGVIVDAFSGIGGNAIQFGLTKAFSHIICIENTEDRAAMAQQNLQVYGVDNVDVVLGDFFTVGPTLKV